MQQLYADVTETIEELDRINTKIWNWTDEPVFDEMKDAVELLQPVIMKLIANKEILNQCGMNIDEMEITNILQQVVEAMGREDMLVMAEEIEYRLLAKLVEFQYQIGELL